VLAETVLFLVCLAYSGEPNVPTASDQTPRRPAEHWAFQPITRPVVPTVKDTAWSDHPIDRFVLAKLEEKGWKPAKPAEPSAILRRTFLSVVGLPPSIDQQKEFSKLPTKASLDELVDYLLQQPGYGERWGRHWLDLVRYADSNGYERDSDKPFAWRYRDYVIRSFNDDKPFDQFVREQIAGDSIERLSADAQVGLGYYLVGPWDDEPTNPEQARYDQLDDFVSTTSQVFLGMDFGCARCHDHKHDPITQEDYYAFAAVFAGVRRPVKQGREIMMRVGESNQVQQAHDISRRVDELQSSIMDVRRRLAKSLQRQQAPSDSPVREREGNDETNNGGKADSLGELTRELARLRREAADLEREFPSLAPAYLPRFDEGPIDPCFVLLRGEIRSKSKEVQADLPQALRAIIPLKNAAPIQRSILADWLCRPDHVLVARVIVNRVWQEHFGVGIVRTPNDFGLTGDRPTHPELLDWLAHWFVHDAGWSLKRLHRLVLTSNTYRMSQEGLPEQIRDDPANLLFARFARRRLDVEAIHDGMLSASGWLNIKMYGPPVYPYLAQEVKLSHESAVRTWLPFQEREASRRAVYAVVKRSIAVPLFEAMDKCDPNRSVGQRTTSNGASHALVALNDEFVSRQSRRLAERIRKEAGPQVESQIELAYRLVVCRPPSPDEVAAIRSFIDEDRKERHSSSTDDGDLTTLAEACRAIFNLNEFYFPD
jgi:hypothetical protein